MLATLHITSTKHDKEAKHVVNLVTIWALPNKAKEVNVNKPSVKNSSIFPKDTCDAWIAKLKQHAASCGISLSEALRNTDPETTLQPDVVVRSSIKIKHALFL